MKGFS